MPQHHFVCGLQRHYFVIADPDVSMLWLQSSNGSSSALLCSRNVHPCHTLEVWQDHPKPRQRASGNLLRQCGCRSHGELQIMVNAVLQGMVHMDAMLQSQAVMLNGVLKYCQALEQGQQVLLEGQAIIIHGQKVLLEEVLSLHNNVNSVLEVSLLCLPLAYLSATSKVTCSTHSAMDCTSCILASIASAWPCVQCL